MIIKEKEVIYQNVFLDRLIEIQEYVGRFDAKKGRLFVNQIFNFTLDIIAEQPFGFVKYSSLKHPDSDIRKAVFKKDYLIFYKIEELTIDFIEIIHTSRNPDNILL